MEVRGEEGDSSASALSLLPCPPGAGNRVLGLRRPGAVCPCLAEGHTEPGGGVMEATARLMLEGSCSPSLNTY